MNVLFRSVVVVAALLSGVAAAHIKMTAPPSWISTDSLGGPQKDEPCGINPDGGMSVIEAEVPLAEVQRYASDLRSITQGRGAFELSFDHYGEVPSQIATRIASEHKAEAQVH